jgi:hypothetical protein
MMEIISFWEIQISRRLPSTQFTLGWKQVESSNLPILFGMLQDGKDLETKKQAYQT